MASFQRTFENETHEERRMRLKSKYQARYRKRQKTRHEANIDSTNIGIKHHELGKMDRVCVHCNAKFWIEEKDQKSNCTSPSFAVCCAGGKVSLPPLLMPPSYLMDLYTSSNSDAASFRKNIRGYNNLLACTSFGTYISNEFRGQGVSNFRIHG